MPTAEIPTLTETRIEPASFQSEELGDVIWSARRQVPVARGWGTTSSGWILGFAPFVGATVVEQTAAGDLEGHLQAWSRAEATLSRRPRVIVLSRARGATSGMPQKVVRRQPAGDVAGGVSTMTTDSMGILDREYEFVVTPEPKQVRHLTARIVSRRRGEPNPVLD